MNERLKEIKEAVNEFPETWFFKHNAEWLIQTIEQQQEEIKRYKQALGKIVADGTYYPSSYSDGNKPCYTRAGEIARKALQGESNE